MKTGMIFGMLCALAAAHGELTRDGIRAAADYAAGHRGTALLVIQHGKTIFNERQNAGPAAMKIYSGTKGFWNAAANVFAIAKIHKTLIRRLILFSLANRATT